MHTLQTSAARTVWPRSATRACTHSVRPTLSSFCVKFVVFFGACTAGCAAGGDVVNLDNVTPPLPNADFSVVVPKSSWPHEAFTRQTLLPNQRMMIVLEDISSVRVWPRNILTEAYDVDDGLCDLGSLKSYMYLFGKTPIAYNFWEVTYHQIPASGQTVKALVFISPPREYHTRRKQEFCFQFRERKGTGSMFVLIKTSEATHGGAVSLVLTVVGLLFFVAVP